MTVRALCSLCLFCLLCLGMRRGEVSSVRHCQNIASAGHLQEQLCNRPCLLSTQGQIRPPMMYTTSRCRCGGTNGRGRPEFQAALSVAGWGAAEMAAGRDQGHYAAVNRPGDRTPTAARHTLSRSISRLPMYCQRRSAIRTRRRDTYRMYIYAARAMHEYGLPVISIVIWVFNRGPVPSSPYRVWVGSRFL